MTDYELITPSGYCGFKMNQKRDPDNNKVMLVAAHDCANYGVMLSVLFYKTDWEE